MIKLLIGGSPCTHWSIAQKNNRETTAQGIGWELFLNYLIAKEKFKPDLFLYENNKSAAQPIKDQISKELGVDLMYINSALVSAQNRQRFYAFNWKVEQPQDRGIVLADILESGQDLCSNDKAYCLTATYDGAIPQNTLQRKQRTMIAEPVSVAFRDKAHALTASYANKGDGEASLLSECFPENKHKQKSNYVAETVRVIPVDFFDGMPKKAIRRVDGKTYSVYEVHDGLIEIKGKKYPVKLPDGYYIIRKLTVTECCRLQTLPDDYCRAVSPTQAYKGLGNGWTAEVIIHILNGALKDVPKNEEILCLSMYDGIGTGRYCLDKMGFTNMKYYAYEIDKYAMNVANSNYPDIIQCGDAFDVRREGWSVR